MRVKVEGDDGELLALLVVEEPDANNVTGWRLFLPGKPEKDGNVWARTSPMHDAGHALDVALKAHYRG